MLQDEMMAETAFYGSWYFYPYRNPNPRGHRLTSQQLYQVLNEELDFFLPKLETIQDLEKQFSPKGRRKQNYSYPNIPAHLNKLTGEEQVGEDEKEEWSRGAYVIIADDLDCKWARLFHVNDMMCQIRLLRRFRRQGFDIRGLFEKDFERVYLSDHKVSDIDEDNTQQDLLPIIGYYKQENKLASDWLEVYSPHECYLYSISASYFKIVFIQTVVENLEEGTMSFEELMEQSNEDVDQICRV